MTGRNNSPYKRVPAHPPAHRHDSDYVRPQVEVKIASFSCVVQMYQFFLVRICKLCAHHLDDMSLVHFCDSVRICFTEKGSVVSRKGCFALIPPPSLSPEFKKGQHIGEVIFLPAYTGAPTRESNGCWSSCHAHGCPHHAGWRWSLPSHP